MVALHNRLNSLAHDAIVSLTPAFCSLGIGYDPATISYVDLVLLVQEQFDLIESDVDPKRSVVRIPVCYSASCGIDLEHVSATTGLSRQQIIELHSGRTYRAYMLGFLPGFAYLGSIDKSLRVDRQAEPRLKVPAGSVGLAGEQTGVYPCEAPGGWQIIGRTPIPLMGQNDSNQFLISPGDQVQFYSIDQAKFDTMLEQNESVEEQGLPYKKMVVNQDRNSVALNFKTAGLKTSVQDFGRAGYQHLGIPSGGAMDRFSATIANRLVGNDDHASLIEVTLLGPVIEISGDCLIAITGANLSPQINGQAIPMWETVAIRGKQRLSFGARQTGCRSYLSISGELNVPRWLGSVSPSPSGSNSTTNYRSLKGQTLSVSVAQKLDFKRSFPPDRRPTRLVENSNSTLESAVPIVPGPEWDWFSDQQQTAFLNHQFEILPNSNSMGYRLSSFLDSDAGLKQSMISSAVVPGVIQVTPNGQSILLMRDAQTTGGYPRIGVVCNEAINEVAQLCPGDSFRFKLVDEEL